MQDIDLETGIHLQKNVIQSERRSLHGRLSFIPSHIYCFFGAAYNQFFFCWSLGFSSV